MRKKSRQKQMLVQSVAVFVGICLILTARACTTICACLLFFCIIRLLYLLF